MTDISVKSLIEKRFGQSLELDQVPETCRSLLEHRSHRAFLEKDILEDQLDLLFACAFSAPSKSDLQQVSILKITDPEKRSAIGAIVPQFPWVTAAPVLLVICGDNRRLRKVSEMRGKTYANNHLDMFMNASVDAALVMGNLIQAANACGLGGCPVSMIRDDIDRLQEILKLPEGVFPLAGLALGHPAGEGEISPRLPLSVTVMENGYEDSDLEQQVADYDRRRDQQQPFDSGKQRYSDQYEDCSFYGWSEDKARQYSRPHRDAFGGYIRRQGFNLD